MYTEEDFARFRARKKYEISQYWDVVKQGITPMPWDFGCADWEHDETGQLNLWIPRNPDAIPYVIPEGEDSGGIPLEKQKYPLESEPTQWENLQHGWSKKIDQGMISDYWRDYESWN